ncbi:hypothetical protein PsorP6_001742 [Peronosclerospora sorghi]|uniref:Uncharacterized protein n=1 Tax=Peronosclerospora sorghi TaxID=230839 RepID=A0ACC0WYA5_9STRA|nr:hypothetical protein PsorP6_001742 [Peronosclerospora sorghi]
MALNTKGRELIRELQRSEWLPPYNVSKRFLHLVIPYSINVWCRAGRCRATGRGGVTTIARGDCQQDEVRCLTTEKSMPLKADAPTATVSPLYQRVSRQPGSPTGVGTLRPHREPPVFITQQALCHSLYVGSSGRSYQILWVPLLVTSDIRHVAVQKILSHGENQSAEVENRNDPSRLARPKREIQFFNQYDELVTDYMADLELDLSADTKPPKDLYIEVRVLRDCGDVMTESGVINLEAHSQHFLRRVDVEQFIRQGLLEQIKR